MSSSIPIFYRLIFTLVDTALTIFAIVGNIVAPTTILTYYAARPTLPPSPETTFLLDETTGFFTCLRVLQLFLLRARPTDLGVWRAIQGGTAIVDVTILASLAKMLSAEKRTGMALWRSEEWINISIIAGLLLARTAFVLGIGMRGIRSQTSGKIK